MKKTIGDLLRLKRQEKGYTLETTANHVGVSINYISKLEKGDTSNPSDEVIVNLASTLEIDEDELFHAFEKVPLSTRKTLHAHPTLSKAIADVSSIDDISEEQREKFIKKIVHWYKEILKDDD